MYCIFSVFFFTSVFLSWMIAQFFLPHGFEDELKQKRKEKQALWVFLTCTIVLSFCSSLAAYNIEQNKEEAIIEAAANFEFWKKAHNFKIKQDSIMMREFEFGMRYQFQLDELNGPIVNVTCYIDHCEVTDFGK
jgi:hypothetical protein